MCTLPYYYAHFPLNFSPPYCMLSPFLARIAKGCRLTFVESLLADSPWSRVAFEHGCWWNREVSPFPQCASEYFQANYPLYQFKDQTVLVEC